VSTNPMPLSTDISWKHHLCWVWIHDNESRHLSRCRGTGHWPDLARKPRLIPFHMVANDSPNFLKEYNASQLDVLQDYTGVHVSKHQCSRYGVSDISRFKSRLFPGPLVLVALLYEGISIILAWMVSQIFWVPHRFR
jgi:hypothetical protein